MSTAVLPECRSEKFELTSPIAEDKDGLAAVDSYDSDAQKLAEVEDLQEKPANDEADEDAYRVEEAWEVATKVNELTT